MGTLNPIHSLSRE